MNRFAGSCIAQGASAATLDGLIAALPQAMPGAGEWFPRLEMRCGETGPEFHFRLRPAPQRWQVAVAWIADGDPRTAPRVKGPDLDELMQLRATAESHGADEAVIVNGCGELIEAAGCSIAWWEGEVLHLVSASEPVLAGVTRRLLHDLADNCEVEVKESLLPAADADRHEVWLLNALVGIVPVTGWVNAGDTPDRPPRTPPLDQARLAAWRQRLESLARPIS
jgi:branched-subunit amino acid aminotransferase/4-amino-4-deoxychorismate lyase